MRSFIMWLIFLAIDIFKVTIVFFVIFGIAAISGFLYAKDFINLILGNSKMWNFIGSAAVAVFCIVGIIAVALFLFALPAFEALKSFHFG